MCGSVDVWKCMCKSGNIQMSRYLTHFYLNLVVWKSEVWKSESVEVQKCWSVEMWKCGSAQIWKYANESLPYSHLSWLGNVEVWKCRSVEVRKSANMQMSLYLTYFVLTWKCRSKESVDFPSHYSQLSLAVCSPSLLCMVCRHVS